MSCSNGSSGSPPRRRPWRSWRRPSPRPPAPSRRRRRSVPPPRSRLAGLTPRPAYPQQNVLPVWPDNPADGSAAIGDIPYDEIAPKLNALQAASNRISARVAGKSSGGRDLYAVVVTAPETAAEAAQQGAWRQLIEDEPVRAREDAALLAGYKTPLFINGNIHGNEKEGTDAIVRVIEQYATSTDPADRDAAQAQHPDLQRHVEPGRPHRQHARQQRGLRPQPRPDDRLAAGGPADPRPDRRAPADHHARPARLRQPDAAAPEHAAAQRQQRVRPLHQARAAERAQHRDGHRRPRLPGSHARADPLPRRRTGRVGRLPADLRAVVRDAAEQHPVHDRGAAAAQRHRRHRDRAAPTSTPTSTRWRSRPR